MFNTNIAHLIIHYARFKLEVTVCPMFNLKMIATIRNAELQAGRVC